MKKLLFLFIALFLVSGVASAQVDVPDSSQTNTSKQFRRGLPIMGITGWNGIYRILSTDNRGAPRRANFDSLKVNIISSVSTDTILVTDDFSFSPVIRANTSIKFRTNKMPSSSWIYLNSGDSIQLDFIISNGDTVFVSSVASVPDVQLIRGKVK